MRVMRLLRAQAAHHPLAMTGWIIYTFPIPNHDVIAKQGLCNGQQRLKQSRR
ncbi:MAG: hypothetical protein JWR67_949 [Mucilaginibacter sp.]|nr:hypothetical protein [Mucilaginibacter sp.]